jgi:hypothetical protein
MTTPIGIPYARSEIDERGYYVQCPKCPGPGGKMYGQGRTEDEITKSAASLYAWHYEWHLRGEVD